MVGVAVKVMLIPAQTDPPGLATMLTLAAPPVFTDMVILLDVAGEPVIQDAFDVITQEIMSPLIIDDDV